MESQVLQEKANRLVQELRELMALMSSGQRNELHATLMDGYCLHCGSNAGSACYCMRDD